MCTYVVFAMTCRCSQESAIRALLDACLATPQEQALAAKGELEDPLLGDDSDSSEDSEA